MTMKEAMASRHTVRQYLDKPVEAPLLNNLQARVKELNQNLGLDMKILAENTKAVSFLMKLFTGKNVKNYLLLSADEGKEEALGYASADFMLFAQTLGLNTWWIGGTYNHDVSSYSEGKKTIGIVAFGYGANEGRPHKGKKYENVASYKGEAPTWFKEGVEASLLAPTAINRQAFQIRGEGNKVRISYKSGAFSFADLGIVKYHFELGAGKENFVYENE